jgi:uncharacterized protein (TIGR03435 family)
MKRLFTAALLVSAALAFAPQLFAQASNPAPAAAAPPIKFDVVSFRKCDQIDQNHKATILPPNGDSIARHCQSMLALLDFAYSSGTTPYIVKGGPAWAFADGYDFQAKVAAADVAKWQAMDLNTKRLMVRAALTDRLNLKVHLTTEPSPVYDLIIAWGGPRIFPSTRGPDTPTRSDIQWVTGDEAAYTNTTMASFANSLSARLDRNVVDKTGLKGAYSFHVKPLVPEHYGAKAGAETFARGERFGHTFDANGTPMDADGMPQVDRYADGTKYPDFTAVREGVNKLGLDLVPTTGETDVVVIDHIDKPAQN